MGMDKKELMIKIGNNVRSYRMERKMTQSELANLVDKNNSAITRIESGVRMMSVPLLCEISDALNVSCDAILRGAMDAGHIENIRKMLEGQTESSLARIERIIRVLISEYGDTE